MSLIHLLQVLPALFPLAEQEEKPESKQNDRKPEPPPEEPPVITEHEIRLGDGERLTYRATAGYLPMKDEEGKLKANVFFVAYERAEVGDRAACPVTFAFNGGPGSSSVWLHLGALGPRRVVLDEEGHPLPAPYRLADNAETWLTFTDLVLIDPVLTGYSRPAPGEDKKQFHGLKEDLESVGGFIRLWTTKYQRWSSPKFLAGESYGTTRAAGLSHYLQERYGMYLSGVILISSALDFQTIRFSDANDLVYPLILPTYTATAWYHRRLPERYASLGEAVQAARAFALGDYLLALAKGACLTEEERLAVARRLAGLAGVSEDFVLRNHLRVPLHRYSKELLRDEGRTVGRLDSRFKGMDRDDAGEGNEYDPSYAAIHGPFTAALNAYLREELGYQNDLPYEILTDRVEPWEWGSAMEGYPYVGESLRKAMSQNPHLRVFVANGYYDMATPLLATEYTFAHLGGDPSLLERVTMAYYEAGHMMYIHELSRRALAADVHRFVSTCAGSEEPGGQNGPGRR